MLSLDPICAWVRGRLRCTFEISDLHRVFIERGVTYKYRDLIEEE